MTTIVYRDGVLAGDTRESLDGIVLPSLTRKVHRLRDGRLFAWTGDCGLGEKVRRHFNGGPEPPDIEGKGCAIVIDLEGRIWTYEQNILMRERAPYIARGSGYRIAYGALAVGATAVDAVRAAVKLDQATGGPILKISLRKQR